MAGKFGGAPFVIFYILIIVLIGIPALLAVITVGWCMQRAALLRELSGNANSRVYQWLSLWLRFVTPSAMLLVGVWWLLTEVFGILEKV